MHKMRKKFKLNIKRCKNNIFYNLLYVYANMYIFSMVLTYKVLLPSLEHFFNLVSSTETEESKNKEI